jgi:hypothetical protein
LRPPDLFLSGSLLHSTNSNEKGRVLDAAFLEVFQDNKADRWGRDLLAAAADSTDRRQSNAHHSQRKRLRY